MTCTRTLAGGAAPGSHLYVPECATDVSPNTTDDTIRPWGPRDRRCCNEVPPSSDEMYLSICKEGNTRNGYTHGKIFQPA